MTLRFDKYWGEAIAESYITLDAYFDVRKEVCLVLRSYVAKTLALDLKLRKT
ncbi:hypothetical protein PTT_00296 [Pyrenophora teres f. teres 0-1]|uniref:Uncharacterized protein n=1 Tax=Pyrenophora teres f. teres (strain 0-1) TaxID=861557 RepID=E3RCD5_PYRTT|nr:hypothetical protein PTT_00296 [Pyrenophora teres f. teres 0-1]